MGKFRLWLEGKNPVERVRREEAAGRAEVMQSLGDFFDSEGYGAMAEWHWREAGRSEARSWGLRPPKGEDQ